MNAAVKDERRFQLAPALLVAIALNVALFVLMQVLVAEGERRTSALDMPMIDYTRIKEEPVRNEPTRRPPPKPNPPEQPKLETITTQTPQQPVPLAPLPPMKLSPVADLGGPSIGAMGAPQWVDAGTLVALVRIPPEYPAQARMRRISGFVDVEFTVDREGRVRNATVVGSNPPGVFDRAALNSIAHWRFEPKKENGQAVDIIARQRIEFELNT